MGLVYVIVEETGEYSSYSKETICVFLNREKAENYITEHNHRVELLIKAKNELYIKLREWEGSNPHPRTKSRWTSTVGSKRSHSTKDLSGKQKELLAQYEVSLKLYAEDYQNFQASCVDAMDYLLEDEKARLKVNEYFTTEDWRIEEVELME